MRITYLHWTRSKGIKGKILEPHDFYVREIIDKKFLQKFSRNGNGITRPKKYTLYLLRKEGMTTKETIKIISRRFSVPQKEIGYAGLKDKFAVTEQYITMEKDIGDFHSGPFSLKKIKPTDKFISRGDLVGNEFIIALHNVKFNRNIIEEVRSKPMPNYFGLQRFGSKRDNHVIGRLIVRKDYGKALEMINRNSKRKYSRISSVEKDKLKFFIHAYQSWIFNAALNKVMHSRRAGAAGTIKIVGCDTKLGKPHADRIVSDVLENEAVKPSDFMLNELSISCRGSSRKAFIKIKDIEYHRNGSILTMHFKLPKSTYATVLLNEICK